MKRLYIFNAIIKDILNINYSIIKYLRFIRYYTRILRL